MPKTKRKVTFEELKVPIPILVATTIPININGVQRILLPNRVEGVWGEELEVLEHSSYWPNVKIVDPDIM